MKKLFSFFSGMSLAIVVCGQLPGFYPAMGTAFDKSLSFGDKITRESVHLPDYTLLTGTVNNQKTVFYCRKSDQDYNQLMNVNSKLNDYYIVNSAYQNNSKVNAEVFRATIDESGGKHEIKYKSGKVIYVEDFIDGRLFGRYWSSDGSIDRNKFWKKESFQVQIQVNPDSTFLQKIDIDPLKIAGKQYKAVINATEIEVKTGEIIIAFNGKNNSPEINGIEVIEQSPGKNSFKLRINCGSDNAWIDSKGNTWEPDREYEIGKWGAIGGKTVMRKGIKIEGSDLIPVYTSERNGMSAYRISCPNGKYKVILHFAETFEGFTREGDRVFQVLIGNMLPTILLNNWIWKGYEDLTDNDSLKKHYAVELYNPTNEIDLKVHTILDGTPVITRWLELKNNSDKPVALKGVLPWSGRLWNENAQVSLCYARKDQWRHESWFDWSTLKDGENIYNNNTSCSFIKPYFLLHNNNCDEYFIGGLAWNANYSMLINKNNGIDFTIRPTAGPNPINVLRVIDINETIVTPSLHIGVVKKNFDSAVQAMHDHVRISIRPSSKPKNSFRSQYICNEDWVESNFRGAEFSETSLMKAVDVAAEAGLEVFILDSPMWGSCYGDWLTPNPQRFPHGLQPLVDYVHSKGLLFALYIEDEGGRNGYTSAENGCTIGKWEESSIFRENPDWFKRWNSSSIVVNLTKPAAADYYAKEVSKVIDYYHLDLYRHDFNSCAGEGCASNPTTIRNNFLESDYWRHFETFNNTFKEIAREYPNLILQQAWGGGARNELSTISRFHENFTSDNGMYPEMYRQAAGNSIFMPPEIMVVGNGMQVPKDRTDFITILRGTYALGNTPMLFNGVLPKSIEQFTPTIRKICQHYADLYKSFIRPLLPECKVYHHAPVSAYGGVENGDWFAMEFMSPDKKNGWALIIRLSDKAGDTYQFKANGLDENMTYQVIFDNLDKTEKIKGTKLLHEELKLKIAGDVHSELLLFKAL
jgi:alpha-galactosidase